MPSVMKGGQVGYKCSSGILFQVASALQSNMIKAVSPCEKGGSQNSGKEQYLRNTPFLTCVYISKCDIKLPFLEIPKKTFFMNRSINVYPIFSMLAY